MHAPNPARAALMGLAAALLLSACGQSADEAAAERTAEAALAALTGHGVEIDDDGETISYRTEEGLVTMSGGGSAQLPGNFPDDVFLPSDYVVESTLAMNDDLFIGLRAREGVPALYAAARESMADQGWSESMAALENNANGLLTFEKDGRVAVLSLAREDDGATMGLQLSQASR